ncbi:MAG: TolC family protein [Gammaproteobacteria bacterium]|nr:TolC family protein [Gammaproteobacteria bacterium]MBU1730828.1 TolC family protein [Gammaproteobacteria bacterium]MBU1891374.1 TolC family protein [Gammaproteobacteria bacterium]
MKPKRRIITPVTAALLALLFALPAVAEPLPGANVESLLKLARDVNPELAAMRHEAQAASERINSAGALPDPMLRTELQDITRQGTASSVNLLPGTAGSTKYTLIQAVPFWGKRDLRRELAEAEAQQAQGRINTSWEDLAARIKTSYAQYYVFSRAEILTRELLDLTQSLEKIAQARYASGLVPQQDVIRAQLEQTGIRSDLVELENAVHHSKVRLNALLYRPATAPLAAPVMLRTLPAILKQDQSSLEDKLHARNPQLSTEAARVNAATKNRELVYRNRYPDFNLGLSPLQTGNRVDAWGMMVEFNIPLQQSSRRSQEREAQFMLAAAESRRDATRNQLLADLAENLSELDATRRIENLAQNSQLPQAELSFKAALAGYENGKVNFATLLDAQRLMLKARLDALKAQGEAQKRLAEIERLLGEDL